MDHRCSPARRSRLPLASLLVVAAGLGSVGCQNDQEDQACAENQSCAPSASSGDGSVKASSGSGMGGEAGEGGGGGAAPSGTTVLVRNGLGEPVAGFDVFASAADGTLSGQTTTASDGTANLVAPAGGSISVAYEDDYEKAGEPEVERRIQTIAFDGEPLQEVRFNVWDRGVEGDPAAPTMAVTASYPAKPGAAGYDIKTNCFSKSSVSTSVSEPAMQDCSDDGLYDIAVIARDASGRIVDYAALSDQPFSAGGSVTHTFTWSNAPVADVSFEVTSIPPLATQLSLETYGSWEQHGSAIFSGIGVYVTDPTSSYANALGHPVAFGNRHCQFGAISDKGPFDAGVLLMKERCGAAADVTPFTWDASRLTRFDVHPPTPEPLTSRWTKGKSGDDGDVISVEQRWSRAGAKLYWTAYLEPGAGELTLPELPEHLAALGFLQGDVLTRSRVEHVDDADLTGFASAAAAGLPAIAPSGQESARSSLQLTDGL